MKMVYVDITNIPELEYHTGISRVVTELVAGMMERKLPLKLLSFSENQNAYQVVDNKHFLVCAKGLLFDKGSIYTNEFLTIEELEQRTIFLDINSGWHTMPNRSYLLPQLKNKQIRIITMIYDLIPIRHPELMNGSTLMKFMEYLSAHMVYTDEMLVSSDTVSEEVAELFYEMNLPEKPIHVLPLEIEFSIEFHNREVMDESLFQNQNWEEAVLVLVQRIQQKPTQALYAHQPIKQIVFLSARPAPLLATLPYVEAFMPFLKELVVCCPERMAEYLQKHYQGRLQLTTITDDELLAGKELPSDHATRNFFLRCLAMELPELDNEFIMSDDDYRPLQEISEEVFYREGKYCGYYFSDISQWKYHITQLFSYDYSQFRTLDFLKANGYPTLLYSSHQPQLINKVWYQEMLQKFPDIRTRGYDEWSTYFNYCAVEHSEQYQALPYVTLSWPPVGGENKGIVQPEYLFENCYADNYKSSRPFAGLSRSFTNQQQVLEESAQKKLVALKYRFIMEEAKKFERQQHQKYVSEFGEFPEVSLYFGIGNDCAPEMGAPCILSLSQRFPNKIYFSVARAGECVANFFTATIETELTDDKGNCFLEKTITLNSRQNYTDMTFYLPREILKFDKIPKLYFWITVQIFSKTAQTKKRIPIRLVD